MARAKGKYEHLTANMRKLPGVSGDANADPRYQDRVDEAKRAILVAAQPGEELAMGGRENLTIARRGLDAIDKQLETCNGLVLRACAGKRHGIELGHAYVAARDMADRLKARLSEVHLLVEAYAQLLGEQCEVEDTRALDVGGRSLSTWEEPYSKIVNKDELRAFFMADRDLLPSLAPPWSTVDMLNRKRLRAGENLLPGTEAWAKRKFRLAGE